MPDPIWLDTNTTIEATQKANAALIAELQSRTAAGQKILITPATRNELLYGNPLTMHKDTYAKGRPEWGNVREGNPKVKPYRPVTELQPSESTRRHIEHM